MSWLDAIPISTNVYVFQSSLICEDCAQSLISTLKDKYEGLEDDGSSNVFPKGPHGDGGGEADSPQFCDSGRNCVCALSVTPKGRKIGCPLGNPLTSDGVLSLRESILNNLGSHDQHKRLVGRLLARVWKDYARPDECLAPWKYNYLPPLSLRRCLPQVGLKVARPVALDTESIYLIAAKNNDASYLLRSTVDDDGEFTKIDSIIVPTSASYDPYKLVAEAVTDMAWD